MKLFVFPFLLLSCRGVLTQDPLKLNLAPFRTSRQFSTMTASGDDGAVAVGLIDALQKWADALETQISLTHGEVLTLRSESRTAKEEISQLQGENVRRDSELSRLRMDTEDIKKTGKDLARRLHVLTSSMTNYMTRISSTTENLFLNSSRLDERLNSTLENVKILSSNTDYVKKKLNTQFSEVRSLSERFNRQESSLSNLNRSSLTLDTFSTTIVNLTNTVYNDIASIKDSTITNFTTLVVEMKSLKLSLRSTLFNATNGIDKRVEALRVDTTDLGEALEGLQRSNKETASKFVRLEGKYSALKDWASQYESDISKHIHAQNNFSDHVLNALSDFGSHLSESREELRRTKPQILKLNMSLINSIGELESQINDLGSKADHKLQKVRQEIFRNAENIEKINMTLAHNSQELSQQLSTLNFVQGNIKNSTPNELLYQFRREILLNHSQAVQNFSSIWGSLREIQTIQKTDSEKLGLLSQNLGSFEEYYINLKRQIFQNRLYIVNFNVSLNDLGSLGADLRSATESVMSKSRDLTTNFKSLSENNEKLRNDFFSLRNDSQSLKEGLGSLRTNVSNLEGNLRTFKYETRLSTSSLQNDLTFTKNKTSDTELRLSTLVNHTLSYRSSLLSLRNDFNSSLLSQKTLTSSINSKISKLYEIHSAQTKEITKEISNSRGNLSELSDSLVKSLQTLETKMEILKKVLYNTVDSTESLEVTLEAVVEGSVPSLRKELDSLQVRIRSTESDTGDLLRSLKNNINQVSNSLNGLKTNVGNVTSGIQLRVTEVENRIRGFSIQDHKAFGKRLETLGMNVTVQSGELRRVLDFADRISSDLGKLQLTLEASQKDFNNRHISLGNNFSVFSIDLSSLRKSTIELQSKVDALGYVDNNFREDFSKLSTEILSIKDSSFDIEGGIRTLKESASSVTNTLETIDESIKRHELVQGNQDKSISDLRSDVASLRAALTSLTNTIFILKARFSNDSPSKHSHHHSSSIKSLDESYGSATNLSTLTREVLFVKNELTSVVRRDMKEVKSDVINLKSILNSMVKQFGSVMDPSRFSCSVTSDEIRTAGVITYSVCNVNSDEMMNTNNGHATIKQSGDYLLSFTANLVSVNSQAVWCALYKQSPGSDGWKVLGMINNFQSDAATEDDRDSASLTLISNLEAGDQIWVEWRGYGESFLYSNPYRLISFTGLLVKKDSSK